MFPSFSDHFSTIFYSRFLLREFTKVLIFSCLDRDLPAPFYCEKDTNQSHSGHNRAEGNLPILSSSPAPPVDARSDLIFASQAEFEYVKGIILERRRLEQLEANHALTNTSTTDPNSQTPTNQGKIKEETTDDIDSAITSALSNGA